MEIEIKYAWDSNKKESYEVEVPARQIVEEALLEIEYPLGGLSNEKITEILAERFSLTEEQRNAKHKGDKYRIRVFIFM